MKENRLDAVSNDSEFSDEEIFAHFDFALIEDKRSSKSLTYDAAQKIMN